jgi:two-component system cell cycle response regulator CpdR
MSAMNLLFVEDEKDLVMLVRDVLAGQGYNVTVALTGAEAIQALASGPAYAVVITDVSMPGGISGIEVAEAAGRLQPDAKVIMVSGYQRAQLPKVPGNVSFLPKPYRVIQLLTRISDVTAGH